MSFLKGSYSTLQDSNYSVILALNELTLHNIQNNIGFYFSMGYIGLYLVVGLAMVLMDRA